MSVEKFNNLKNRFLQMHPDQRRILTESLHKLNLGVEDVNDTTVLTKFLGFDAKGLNPQYAEELISFLLATGSGARMPVSNALRNETLEDTDAGLPQFQQDETDTLVDDVKPFK